jgi:hypothetical protein
LTGINWMSACYLGSQEVTHMTQSDSRAHDGTGAGMDEFLAWAGRTGELNPTTAGLLRSTANKILALDGDPNETDVTKIDADSMLQRWETLNRTRYTPGSLQTYKSRFNQAVAMYRAWLVNDPGWKDAGRAAGAGMTSRANKTSTKKAKAKASNLKTAKAPTVEVSPVEDERPMTISSTRMTQYDLPLRPDLIIRLTLPVDFNESDAARIAAFVKSVAFTATPGPVAPLATKSTLGAG